MEWWGDQEGKITCCRFATPAEIDADPEAYTCEECQERILKDAFTRAEKVALALYEDLSNQVVQDLHLTPLIFDTHRLRLTEDEAHGLIRSLQLIHHERMMVVQRKSDRQQRESREPEQTQIR